MSPLPRGLTYAALLTPGTAGSLVGQGIVPVERNWAGLYAMVAPATGEFAQHADVGGGGGVYAVAGLDRDRVIGLRVQVSGTILGGPRYTVRYSSPGYPDEFQVVRYYHAIVSLAAGPQLTLPGRHVRPYVTGQIGISYVFSFWERRWEYDDPDLDPLDSGTGTGDFNLPLSAGGGLMIQLRRGARPLWLDLSAHWVGHGQSEYVRDDSIADSRWGTPVRPTPTRMSLWEFRAGVATTF